MILISLVKNAKLSFKKYRRKWAWDILEARGWRIVLAVRILDFPESTEVHVSTNSKLFRGVDKLLSHLKYCGRWCWVKDSQRQPRSSRVKRSNSLSLWTLARTGIDTVQSVLHSKASYWLHRPASGEHVKGSVGVGKYPREWSRSGSWGGERRWPWRRD